MIISAFGSEASSPCPGMGPQLRTQLLRPIWLLLLRHWQTHNYTGWLSFSSFLPLSPISTPFCHPYSMAALAEAAAIVIKLLHGEKPPKTAVKGKQN